MSTPLDDHKRAAHALKKAFRAGDPSALARMAGIRRTPPQHADFLHIVALETGHESWPKLKFALETAGLDRSARADRLKIALYYGQHWKVERLLAADPDLGRDNLGLAIALYDLEAAQAALAADPAAATRPIGPRTPLLHLAFSQHFQAAPEKRDAMLAIARLLLGAGADPDESCPAAPDSDHRLSALYGAIGHARNIPLAALLLEAGATPDDDESLYHATEAETNDGLRLLIRHGARTSGTNALPRALDFDDIEKARLLLAHGADPNEAVKGHPSGQPVDTIPALHQAARRWRGPDFATLLLDHGADPDALWAGRTAYATARVYGNDAFAGALAARGCAAALSPTEQMLSDCAAGRAPAERIRAEALSEEDRRLPCRIAAGPDRLAHLKALIAAGFDPDAVDEMGLSMLHIAGWEGFPDRVAWALTLQPDLARENDYGGDALDTTIHGAEFCPAAAGRDHLTCARLILKAGATLYNRQVEGCGREDLLSLLEDWRDAAP